MLSALERRSGGRVNPEVRLVTRVGHGDLIELLIGR